MIPLERPPASICLLRLSALGDVTHALPVARALQDRWPDCALTWIIGASEHRLLEGVEGIEFLVFNKRGGLGEWRRIRSALRSRKFDVLLHMQVAARANLLSTLVRAPVRLGWDRSRSRDLHGLFINQRIPERTFQHQADAFFEFARALGADRDEPRWDLPLAQEARDWAAQMLAADRQWLLISPCSSHPRRNWSADRYATVADFAVEELGLAVVLSGGPSELERHMGQSIEGAMKQDCLNLIGKDTLEQSKALLERADVVLSPDSGPVHIASALGTAVIGLYASTWSRRSGPRRSLELCVDRFPQAAQTFRGSSAEQLRWGTRIENEGVMDLISPQDVKERLRQWQQSQRPFPASGN